jgi:farnesyl-diphosphate farnesyltransferase
LGTPNASSAMSIGRWSSSRAAYLEAVDELESVGETMTSPDDVMRVLQETSRTFFLPIRRLSPGLQDAIAAAYLCMRAIDEIEDHPHMEAGKKSHLLRQISQHLQAQASVAEFPSDVFLECFAPYQETLPSVTLRLVDWVRYAPAEIAPRIWDATATMAQRMAEWAENGWYIQTETDLDRYTYGVAGATGLLLCDVWAWSSGEQLDRSAAIRFGRGLQAVNILRNRQEDLARGVDFFPATWTQEQMHHYARKQLEYAQNYARTLTLAPFEALIHIPLALATATLDALARGDTKLSRGEVLRIVDQIETKDQQDFSTIYRAWDLRFT